jgi:deoxyribonuclease-2
MDGETGFWMIHTVPRFAEPVGTGKYVYPASGKENGQTAMCISFHTPAELDNIMTQLLCIHPNVYDSSISEEISRITPKITDLISRHWPKQVSESTRQISSKNGQLFTSFARNSKSQHKELYLEVVAPGLGSDLLVETWRRGAGDPLPSNCSYKYKVNNVNMVELKFEPGSEVRETSAWEYIEDHSKWAVAMDQPAACLGDINRMASQYKRGGGSLCMRNHKVWQVMKNSIHETEPCPRVSHSGHGHRSSGSSDKGQRNKLPMSQVYLMLFALIPLYLLSLLLSAGNNDDL